MQHTYRGNRAEVDALIQWLMDKNYWFEASPGDHGDDAEWHITCGVDPSTVRDQVHRLNVEIASS